MYTYDLLHIALYPHNSSEYGPVIAQVFAQARHHECIFHAEQDIGVYFRETWGRGYAATHPEEAGRRPAPRATSTW